MADRITFVDTKRVAQLTGDRDPQDWPMMNVTGGWNVVGVDEGPTTEHDGKLFIFFGDVATSDNGGNHPLGWNFILPNNVQGATDTTGQRDWRFCGKCHGLFYAPQQDATGTVCPAGNQHQPEGWVFYLPSQEQGASPDSGQPDWHFCGICHGLSWTGAGSPGTCPGSKPGGFRLHPVMRDGQNFDPVRAGPPVGITKSLERPGGPFSYEGRAYTFANVSPPRYSEQVRFGNPAFGNYLISKADPAQPGPFGTEFLFSPRIGALRRGRLDRRHSKPGPVPWRQRPAQPRRPRAAPAVLQRYHWPAVRRSA